MPRGEEYPPSGSTVAPVQRGTSVGSGTFPAEGARESFAKIRIFREALCSHPSSTRFTIPSRRPGEATCLVKGPCERSWKMS